MINKIVVRILRLPKNLQASSYSSGGKQGKPPVRPFFGRRQEIQPQVQEKKEKIQEPVKVVNKPSFLRSLKKTEPSQSAKPQLRFRKKQTFDTGATQPAQPAIPAGESQSVSKQEELQQYGSSQLYEISSSEQQPSMSLTGFTMKTESDSIYLFSEEMNLSQSSGTHTRTSTTISIHQSESSTTTIEERHNLLLSTEETQLQKSDDSTQYKDTKKRDRAMRMLIAEQLNLIVSERDPIRHTFFGRFSNDAAEINTNFRNRNWDFLNKLVESYYATYSSIQIQKEFHLYLIELDGVRYVQWLDNLKPQYKDLSQLTLTKLYNKLLSQQAYKELKSVLNIFKDKSFRLTYSSIQNLYLDIQTDGKTANLQQKIKEKIDITKHILQVQLKNFKINSNPDQITIVSIDTWFEKIAFLALTRNIAVAKFLSLFQELFSNHYDHVNLGHFYKNNLFFDVLNKFYFGSHISTQRIHSLFKDISLTDNYELYLKQFRDLLFKYRSSTGKFAFPNARGLKSQFQKSFQQQNLQLTLLNYVLLIHSDQPYELGQLMQKRQILLKYCEFSYHIRDILDDALFNLPAHILDRKQIEPKPLERTVRRIHPLDETLLTNEQLQKLKERSENAEENNRKIEKLLLQIIQKQKETGASVDMQKQYPKQRLVQLLGADLAEEFILKQQIQKMKQQARLLMKGDMDTEQVKQYYINSQFPQTLHKPKGYKKWKDYTFQQQYRFKDPNRLGWDYNKFFISYYGTLIEQAQSQGNPYRRQLIRNILRADLRTSQQDIRRISLNKYDNDEQTVDETQQAKEAINQYTPQQFQEYFQIRANQYGLLQNKEEEKEEEYMYTIRNNWQKQKIEEPKLQNDNPLTKAFEAKILFDNLAIGAHLTDLFVKNGKKQNIDYEQSEEKSQQIFKKLNNGKTRQSHEIARGISSVNYLSKTDIKNILNSESQPTSSLSIDQEAYEKMQILSEKLIELYQKNNQIDSSTTDILRSFSLSQIDSETFEGFKQYKDLSPKDAKLWWKNGVMPEQMKAQAKKQALEEDTILADFTVGYLMTEQPQETWQDVDRYQSVSESVEEKTAAAQSQGVAVEGQEVAAEGEQAAAEGEQNVAEGEGEQAAVAEGEQAPAEGGQAVAQGEGQQVAEGEGQQAAEGEGQLAEGEQNAVPNWRLKQKQKKAELKREKAEQQARLSAEDEARRQQNKQKLKAQFAKIDILRNPYASIALPYLQNIQKQKEQLITFDSDLQTPREKRQRKYKQKVARIRSQQRHKKLLQKEQQLNNQHQQNMQQRIRQDVPIQRPVKLLVITKIQSPPFVDEYQVKNKAMNSDIFEVIQEGIVKMYKQGAFDSRRQSKLRIDEEQHNSEDLRKLFNISNILYESIDDAIVVPSKQLQSQQKQQIVQQQPQKEQKIYLKYKKTQAQKFLQDEDTNSLVIDTDIIKDSQWSSTFNTSDFVTFDIKSEDIQGQQQHEKSNVDDILELMKEYNPSLVQEILITAGRKVNNVEQILKKKLQNKTNEQEKNGYFEIKQKQDYKQLVEPKDKMVREQYIQKLVDLYLRKITKTPQQYRQFKQVLKAPQKTQQFIKKYELDQNKSSPSILRLISQLRESRKFIQVYDEEKTITKLQKLALNIPIQDSQDSAERLLKSQLKKIACQLQDPHSINSPDNQGLQEENSKQKQQDNNLSKIQQQKQEQHSTPYENSSSLENPNSFQEDTSEQSPCTQTQLLLRGRQLKSNVYGDSTHITDKEYLTPRELQLERQHRNAHHFQYQDNIQTTDTSDLLASQNISQLQGQVDMREVNKQRDAYINNLAIKSAIKLKKYQLALALTRKIVMEPLILDRTTRNITFAVQKFLIDEHQRERIPNFEDIIEHVQVSAEQLPKQFLMSVHERCDSFDELIWNYVPPKRYKFQFWHSSLMFNRGQELVKMDIANKLKDLKYEKQYQAIPERQKDQFITFAGPQWRQILLEQLGLIAPKKQEKRKTIATLVQDTEEFKEKFFSKVPQAEDNGQQIQQIAAEGEEAVEAQGIQQVAQEEGQGEEVQQVAEVQAEAGAEVQAAVEDVAAEVYEQAQQQSKKSNKIDLTGFPFPGYEAQVSLNKLQKQYPFANNFQTSTDLRIRGYDFESFLKYSKQNIKPILEQKYEREKEYIKHMINLEGLAEEARCEDAIYLQKKLFQDQRFVKDPQNIAVFASFGLWSYNFVRNVRNPIETRKICLDFRRIFYQFKRYDGKKGAIEQAVFNNQHFIDFQEKSKLVSELKFSGTLVDDLLVRRMKYFKEAEAVVRIQPSPVVQELLLWGVKADEPMAIYLAEKIAMITNQIIPHHIAQKVSRYLSHRHQIPAERIQRCKQALKVVGRINREHIYDFNREYDHITVRKHFTDHLEKREKQLESSAIQFLMRVDPTHAFQSDTKNLENNIKRSSFVV